MSFHFLTNHNQQSWKRVYERKLNCFLKNLIFKEKKLLLTLFEFLELFIIGFFLIKLTQFEKTGSISKIFISLGNLNIRKQKSITSIMTLTLLLFDTQIDLSFNKGNELN